MCRREVIAWPVMPSPENDGFGDLESLALAWSAYNRTRTLRLATSSDDLTPDFGPFDPTRGATRFHRHDEAPDWARYLSPVALIGRYLFYVA